MLASNQKVVRLQFYNNKWLLGYSVKTNGCPVTVLQEMLVRLQTCHKKWLLGYSFATNDCFYRFQCYNKWLLGYSFTRIIIIIKGLI